jgi:CheY-like chemotaxis protein
MEPRAESQGESTPDLAAGALDRLRRQGGEDLVQELLDSFRARTPARLGEARAALAVSDHAAAARVFHSLKSSAALIGALAIEADALAAERAAERADEAGIRRSTAAIEAAFERLLPRLETAWNAPPRGVAEQGLRRIALVEDNEDNRLLARVLLGQRFAVDEYATGVEALAGIVRSPPDLVLLDVSLPGMDGLEVLAGLRSLPDLARMPIVALTAHAMQGDRERLFAAGFDDYVAKPIRDAGDFVRRIERLLGELP